jgi:hypothetical protein
VVSRPGKLTLRGWLEGYRQGESLTHLTAFGKLKAGWGVYSGREALLRTRGDGSTELTDHMDTPLLPAHVGMVSRLPYARDGGSYVGTAV